MNLQVCQLLIRPLTSALTVPLFTSCCAFIFYIPGFYWNFDWSKPSYSFYSYTNWVLQVSWLFLSKLNIPTTKNKRFRFRASIGNK